MKSSGNRRGGRSAFTLIELLVVVGLIAIIAVAVGIASPSSSASLGSAVRIAGAMAKMARSEAVVHGTEARLLILKTAQAEEDNNTKRLRSLIVVYKQVNEDGTSGWVASSTMDVLPAGVFFHEELSTRSAAELSLPKTMRFSLETNELQDGNTGDEYYYYSFTASGLTEENAGSILVFCNAELLGPGDIKFNITDISGFMLHRLGSVSVAENVDDLTIRKKS